MLFMNPISWSLLADFFLFLCGIEGFVAYVFFKWIFKFAMAVMVHLHYKDSKNGLVLCVCVNDRFH